jgi:Fe-S-cluster containining protein
MADNIPCDYCGACCRTFPIFAGRKDAECEPLVKIEGCEVAEWESKENKKYQLHPLPFRNGCCFLNEENLCHIYSTRPQVCRKFEAGSEQCTEARARIGLTALKSVL